MRITISKEIYTNKIESKAAVNKSIREQYKIDTGIRIKAVRWDEVDNITPYVFYKNILSKHIWTTGLYFAGVRSSLTSNGTIGRRDKNGIIRPIKPFDNSGYLCNGFCNEQYWSGSWCIFVDVDDTKAKDMIEYVSWFNPEAVPTFGVYSASDTPQKRKFKLVYCFKSPIYSAEEWDAISESIHRYINDNIEKIKDPCGKTRTQISFAGNGLGEWFGKEYDRLENFEHILIKIYSPQNTGVDNSSPPATSIQIDQNLINQLKKNFKVKNLKYINYVDWIYRTTNEVYWLPLEICPFGIGLTKNTYWQLENTPRKDGQQRRRTLYKRMCLRRILNPNATPEQILLNAYKDREDIITDWTEIDVDCLVKNVRMCFSQTIQELLESDLKYTIENLKKRAPVFVFRKPDKNWSVGQRNQLLEDVRSWILGEYYRNGVYNINLSENQNMEIINKKLEDTGFNLRFKSRDIFLKFRNQMNITKPKVSHKPHQLSDSKQKEKDVRNKKVLALYNKGLSYSQIMDEFELDGEHISLGTISKIIKNKN